MLDIETISLVTPCPIILKMNIMPILSILKSDFLQYRIFFHSGPAALCEKKLCIVKNLISKWTIQKQYNIVKYIIIWYFVVLYWIYIVHLEIRFFTIQSFFSRGAAGPEWKKTLYCKKSDFQMDNIGIIFILQIIGQRGVTNEIISIFNMLLYQPIGELYYFNIPLVKYLNMYIVQERLLST